MPFEGRILKKPYTVSLSCVYVFLLKKDGRFFIVNTLSRIDLVFTKNLSQSTRPFNSSFSEQHTIIIK